MDPLPGSNLIDLHPFPNSPSDISCSSGLLSVISTRETSPASSVHHFVHAPPSRSASFQDPLDQIPSTFRKALEMERDPFQTVNIRRGKLTSDVSRASHTSPGITASSATNFGLLQHTTGRPSAPTTFPHSPHSSTSFTPPSTVPRGLYCRDWRTSTASSLDSLGFASSQTSPVTASSACCNNNINKNSLSSTSSGSIFPSPVSPAVGFGSNLSKNNNLFNSSGFLSVANLADSPPPTTHGLHDLNNNSHLDTSTSNFANMHPVNGSFIAEADMDQAMAYCYDRGDGQYTRLVAVDLLPIDLRDIPRRVASDEGMIVLPIPRMPGPNGQPAENQLAPQVAVTPPPSSPSDHTSTDPIQNRIDCIVASSPHGTHGTSSPTAGTVVLANTHPRGVDGNNNNNGGGNASSAVAKRPSHANSSQNNNGNNRRDKVYCDKWIHDGTCAFTQQGCKFKHEMPNDRETQEMLGLFHGYPAWWKKLLAEQQSRSTAAIDDRPVSIAPGRRGAVGSGAGGPAYTTAWRPVQPGPGHPGESVEDVRATGFGGSGGGGGRGVGFGSRGGARQGRSGGAFNAPNYGPIGPPSRLGRAAGRGTRGSAGLLSSNDGQVTIGPTARNPYATLANMEPELGRDVEGTITAAAGTASDDTGENGQQRGAKL